MNWRRLMRCLKPRTTLGVWFSITCQKRCALKPGNVAASAWASTSAGFAGHRLGGLVVETGSYAVDLTGREPATGRARNGRRPSGPPQAFRPSQKKLELGQRAQ